MAKCLALHCKNVDGVSHLGVLNVQLVGMGTGVVAGRRVHLNNEVDHKIRGKFLWFVWVKFKKFKT
jgi:hypothetical protein